MLNMMPREVGNAGAASPGELGMLSAGTVVGDYVVVRLVGAGSFGTVYEGRHPLIGKRVAIKVLSREYTDSASTVARFIAEARVVNEIHHRNIVDIFAFDELPDGSPYFVMEFLDGPTLEHYLAERGALPLDEALPLLRQIASALDAAHRQGVAHRDIKPANIMLPAEEGRPIAKLIDFGIAKLSGDRKPVHETQTGAWIGTPKYMSPEQCHGKPVDTRCDVYAFGLIAHEMLTGQPVYAGEDKLQLMLQHTKSQPPRASSVNPTLPPSVDSSILATLQKEPTARPEMLVPVVDELELAVSMGTMRRGRRGALVALGGAVLIVAAAVAWERNLLSAPPPPPPPTAPAPVPVTLAPRAEVPAPAEPPPPANVHIEIVGDPAGAEVRGPGGKLLGKLPLSLEMPRSESELLLKVSQKGYAAREVSVVPAKNVHVDVALMKNVSPRRPPPPHGPNDPERVKL